MKKIEPKQAIDDDLGGDSPEAMDIDGDDGEHSGCLKFFFWVDVRTDDLLQRKRVLSSGPEGRPSKFLRKDELQGASKIMGGFSRGNAHGNAPNFADLAGQ